VKSPSFALIACLLIGFGSFLFPGAARAQHHFNNCEVLEIVITGTQNGHAQLSCIPSALPPCAAGNPWVAFDKSTPDGRQYLAMLTLAQSTGAKVSGYVANACPAWQNNVALLQHLRLRR
jgi:hypothetical protein